MISHTAAPLAVTLDPDPLVLERTMVKMRYGNLPAAAPATVPGGSDGNGHGNGNGNGHGNGNGNGDSAAAAMDNAGQAAATSTSKLQNILGNAAARGLPGGAGAGISGMISYEESTPDQIAPADGGAAFDPSAGAAFEPAPAGNGGSPMEFAPNTAAGGGNMVLPVVNPAVTRIVATAGAFDALAGSTAGASSIPVTVTTALSPGFDAGSVVATTLDSTPSMVPITAAEPPSGTPAAVSVNATTIVAPQSASPENIPLGQKSEETEMLPPEPPAVQPEPQPAEPEHKPLTFESSQSSPAREPAPNMMPDFFAPTPAASPAPAEPELPPPTVAETTPPPPVQDPAQLTIAPPTIPILPPDAQPPITVQPPEPVQPAASTPQPAAPTIGQMAPVPASFDFFASQANPFPVTTSEPEPPSSGFGTSSDMPAPKPELNVLDTTKFSNGVPSVVQDAIRAAASASQTKMASLSVHAATAESTAAKEEEKTRIIREDDFPDESVKRGKKKTSDDTDSDKAEDTGSNRKRGSRSRDDDSEDSDEKPKEPEKMLRIGSMELKVKTVITAAILLVFLGLPLCTFVLNLAGKVVGGLTTPASTTAVLGGDWSMGVLLPDGQNLKGTINFQQAGNMFTGMGVDSFGSFQITNGSITYQNNIQRVQFQKIYVDEQRRPKGKPITYAGQVDWVNPEPGKGNVPFYSHMYGVWQLQKRQGFGWRGQVVTVTGKWEAGQIRVEAPKDGIVPQHHGFDLGQMIRDALGFPSDGSTAKMSTFFVRIAGILLLLGLGLVLASVKLFGPAGTLNILAKKEYIPSQFRAQHEKMVREFGKAIRAGGLPLGWRADWSPFSFWLPRKLALPPDVRAQNPHVMVLGAGSKGKSRLIASMIHHDIESNDRAVVVIDSDGSLIDLLMTKIAASPKGNDIAKRLIIIDPTHGGDVLAYNPLEYPDDGDLQNAASAVVFGFKAIYTEPPGSQSQWNQQTANILRNSAILLMANGKTLTDLPVLLSENDFRDVLLEKVERLKNEKAEFTTLIEAWAQYKRLARTDQWINWVEPILNRVQPMLGDPRIRPILTKPKGELNLKEIISEGKILFVKVPQGQLDQNANLLGSLIVTGVKQAAMSLSLKGSSRKHACALYLDEFDSFIEKETFDALTSETRKFQIGLVGSSKTLQGLPEDYRNQIVINVGTMCCFALAKKDGDMLGPSMFRVDGRKIKHQTLQNIFNKVNTAPQFELISDEEKLNIDRVVGQEERHFFCYRVGTVAGVFQMRAPDFADVPDKDVNWTLIDQIYARSVPKE